jgi:T4 superinfection immunity protein
MIGAETAANGAAASVFFLVILLVCFVMYFLPAIVAGMRKHRNAGAISVLNFFLGWTLIGWVSALVWAFTDNVRTIKSATATAPSVTVRRSSENVCSHQVVATPSLSPLPENEAQKTSSSLRFWAKVGCAILLPVFIIFYWYSHSGSTNKPSLTAIDTSTATPRATSNSAPIVQPSSSPSATAVAVPQSIVTPTPPTVPHLTGPVQSPTTAATPTLEERAAADGKRDGEAAGLTQFKSGNVTLLGVMPPSSMKSLIKKYGSKEAANAYTIEWAAAFAGKQAALIEDEASKQPKEGDINWWTEAELYIKRSLNDPDSFRLTKPGFFAETPEFTAPHPVRYKRQMAMANRSILFSSQERLRWLYNFLCEVDRR